MISATPLIYLIAGEASGDALGRDLMIGIKERLSGDCAFAGVGGDTMAAAGLDSLFPMEELSVIGLAEVLPRLLGLIHRIKQARDDILARRPALVVTIDSPDFCFRVARAVKQRAPDMPIVHYVAPTVWAWRSGRARKVARFLDHVLCLYAFEPPYFEYEGLAATFVGHPIADQARGGDGAAFRRRNGIADGDDILMVLPGSRRSELTRLLPVFSEVLGRLNDGGWRGRVVTPTLLRLADDIRAASAGWPYPAVITTTADDKRDAMAASRAALAASGTVVLELAAAGLPAVIAYKFNTLTGMIARRLIKIPHAGLVNIVRGKEVMPEYIQEDCRAEAIAPAVLALLTDAEARARQATEFDQTLRDLKAPGGRPAAIAAGVVADIFQKRTRA
ncbi:MAG: lipid-A-disaccharide synthase [Rhodospirillaceae bacterium]